MCIPIVKIATQLNMKTNEKRSLERKDILTSEVKKVFDEIQAFTAYIEGASIDDISKNFDIPPSTLKYKIKKLKDNGIEGILDFRDHNGITQEKKITSKIGQRIQELKIKDPTLSSREISRKLYDQDQLSVSHTIVNEYLCEVNLSDYGGSEFRDSIFFPEVKKTNLESTRYAGQLMLLSIAKLLGCVDASASLDVTDENCSYSNERMYTTNFLAVASGKQRLSHVDELIHQEFMAICGGNYPRKSCNHAYLDKIVVEDQKLIDAGKESIVQKFMDNTTRAYLEAGILEAENLYMDKHVIEVCTEKNIAKDQHALRNTVVKAINEYRIICADTKTTVTSWFFNAGHRFSELLKPALDKVKELKGKPVKLLGVDKGAYNFEKLTEATQGTETCIVVWSKDTPQTLASLAAIPEEAFEIYEKEIITDTLGNEKVIVKTRIADVNEMVIDKDGHKIRTVALKNEQTSRRIGILVFGEKALEYDKRYIADFLYGKQDIENSFKERKKLGGDRFCGGVFTKIEEKPLDEADLGKMKKKTKAMENRIPKLKQNLEKYDTLLEKGELCKRDYNRLTKKAQNDIERLELEQKRLIAKLNAPDCNEKVRHSLDTRKTAVVACIQDHVITCKRYALSSFINIARDILTHKLLKQGTLGIEEINDKVQKRLKGFNMQKISARLFEQGGYVYKDDSTNEFIVIMKNYETPFMQEIYEKLCVQFTDFNSTITLGIKSFNLIFLTEDGFKEKYSICNNMEAKLAA